MAIPKELMKENVENVIYGPLQDPDLPAFDLIPRNFFGMYPDERELWEPEDFNLLIEVLEELYEVSVLSEVDAARQQLSPGASVLVTVALDDELTLYIRENTDHSDGESLLLALGKPGQEANVE